MKRTKNSCSVVIAAALAMVAAGSAAARPASKVETDAVIAALKRLVKDPSSARVGKVNVEDLKSSADAGFGVICGEFGAKNQKHAGDSFQPFYGAVTRESGKQTTVELLNIDDARAALVSCDAFGVKIQ